MMIFFWYITGAEIPEAQAIELVRYLLGSQNTDGGWPTYVGEKTSLMGTVMIYIALRLMGLPAEHEQLVKARLCFTQMGGVVYLPCWAKFWLCLLGLYEWEGTDPYPVEMWYVCFPFCCFVRISIDMIWSKVTTKLGAHQPVEVVLYSPNDISLYDLSFSSEVHYPAKPSPRADSNGDI